MELLNQCMSIRGDSCYCPLSFQIDAYWNCETKCANCYLRRLNRTWGEELKPANTVLLIQTIKKGLESKLDSKNSLMQAIRQRKTLRFGNKSDPYQKADIEWKVSRMIVTILLEYKFSFVIQTKFTYNLERDLDLLGQNKDLVYFMPIVSPGLEKDWDVFENHKTSSPLGRVIFLRDRLKEKFNGGVNGEPFIPGYHTIQDFENTLKLLKEYKIKSYNTYHLHFNDLVAKNFNDLGLDIEKIHHMNQDNEWKKILIQLIDLAKKYDILLGCPDFINSGEYQESSNTCCGIDVPNPCTFNIINWKKGMNFEKSWDGIGDYEQGKKIFKGEQKEFYSLKDIEKKPKSSGSSFLDEMED